MSGLEFFGGCHGIYLRHFESAKGKAELCRGLDLWLTLGRDAGNGVNVLMTAVGKMRSYRENTVTFDRSAVDRSVKPAPPIACTSQLNEPRMRTHQGRVLRVLANTPCFELARGPGIVAPGEMVHEVGTARVEADATRSFCNSWELENLYVPDAPCWTTSAYQNPMLTMLALAQCSLSHLAVVLERREFA